MFYDVKEIGRISECSRIILFKAEFLSSIDVAMTLGQMSECRMTIGKYFITKLFITFYFDMISIHFFVIEPKLPSFAGRYIHITTIQSISYKASCHLANCCLTDCHSTLTVMCYYFLLWNWMWDIESVPFPPIIMMGNS